MLGKALPILILGFIHVLFLSVIVLPHFGWWTLLGVVPFFAYSKFEVTRVDWNIELLFRTVIAFTLGVYITIFIRSTLGVSSVFASAFLGTVVGIIPEKGSRIAQLIKNEKLTLYAGSFAGMASLNKFSFLNEIWLCGIIGGLVFYILKNNFKGLGGKLGSIGFGSLSVYALAFLFLNELPSWGVISYTNCFALSPLSGLSFAAKFMIVITISITASVLVYWLNNYKNWGALKASAITSLIFSIPFEVINFSGLTELVPAVFFGASFVGMSSSKALNWTTLILSGVLFGIIYFMLNDVLEAFGGALGTIACFSCLTGMVLVGMFGKFKRKTI